MAGSLWFLFAIGAAMTWGLSYALSQHLLKIASIPPGFLMMAVGVVSATLGAATMMMTGQFKEGLSTTLAEKKNIWLLISIGLTCGFGNWLIYNSISLKNATLSSLVEISYPVFVAIFAYILYREQQLTLWTGFGGLLIFSGIAIIYLKS